MCSHTTATARTVAEEQTLAAFFDAINSNDVDAALACCAEDVSCTYEDPGRNWKGKDNGRRVMTGIFNLLKASGKTVTYRLDVALPGQINTVEYWGDGCTVMTNYIFDGDKKILAMEPHKVYKLRY